MVMKVLSSMELTQVTTKTKQFKHISHMNSVLKLGQSI